MMNVYTIITDEYGIETHGLYLDYTSADKAYYRVCDDYDIDPETGVSGDEMSSAVVINWNLPEYTIIKTEELEAINKRMKTAEGKFESITKAIHAILGTMDSLPFITMDDAIDYVLAIKSSLTKMMREIA